MATTKKETHVGTGRRKTSVARVRLTPGDGRFTVNGEPLQEYFTRIDDLLRVRLPLEAAGCEKKIDVRVIVVGGGNTGQAGAVQLGIARALVRMNPDSEEILRERRYLTRDARRVERKKYGRAGARRSFQFSKR